MLVLSRKIGESVIIGDNISIRVTDIGGGQVRLGFEAPREVTIDRAEIHAAKSEFPEVDEKPFVLPPVSRFRSINRDRRRRTLGS